MSGIGSAYMPVIPSVSGIGRSIERQLGGSFGGAGKSAGKSVSGGILGAMKGLAGPLAIAGGVAGAALAGGVVKALDKEKSGDKLAAQLGLSPKESERAGKLAGKIYSGAYGDSLGQVNDAVKSVSQNITGLSKTNDKDMQSITEKVLNVSEAFDQDLGGVTRSVGQLIKTGMAKDATSALDLITKGFQSPVNAADDFLDTINEYGTQFRKLGLDGPKSVGLLNQAVGAGARDADTAADALKEFSIRAIDGSKSSAAGFQALGLDAAKMTEQIAKGGPAAEKGLSTVLTNLKGIKDPALQSQAAIALFGTKAEDLGQALYALDPSKAVDSLGKVAGAADAMGDTLNDNGASRIEAFKRGISTTFVTLIGTKVLPKLEQFGTFVKSNLGPALSGLSGFLKPLGGVATQASTTFTTLRPAVESFFTSVVSAAGPVVATFQSKILPAVVSLGSTVLSFAKVALPLVVSGFKSVVGFISTQVIPIVGGIYSAFARLAATVVPIIAQIAGVLVKTFADNLPQIRSIIGEIGSIFASIWSVVKPAFERLRVGVEAVTTVIQFIWSRFGGQITTIIGSTFKTVIGVISGALKIVSGIIKVITSVLTGNWSGAAAGLKKITEGMKQVFVSIFTNIGVQVKTLFGGLITSLVNKGISFTSWLSSSFKVGLSKVKDYILAPVRAARDGIGTVLGGIKTAFSGAVTAIGNIWDGLKEKAAAPIRFVVNTVLKNGLVDAFDKVAGLLPGNLKIGDKISWPAFAGGGIAFPDRYTPGRDIGFAAVSGGEPIMRPEFGRAVGHGTINAWNKAARTGGIGGVRKAMGGFMGAYAKGGIVSPTVSGRQNTSYAGHSGIDFFGRVGDAIRAASAGTVEYTGSGRGYGQAVFLKGVDGLSQVYGHTSSILVRVGQMVKAGMQIAKVGYSGNVRPAGPGGAHLHFEVANGGFANAGNRAFTQSWLRGAVAGGASTDAGGGGLGDLVGSITSKLSGPLGRLKELGGSPMAKLAAAAPPALAKAMVDKVRSSIPSVTDVVTSVAGKFKAGAGVARWTPEVLKALGIVGQSPLQLPRTLRRMNQESSGNPNAINLTDSNARAGIPSKGLMQVIGPTFAAYRDKSLSSNIYDPLANIVASMRYALATYGSLARAYDKSGGYAKGTTNATKGMHWVGENGPELRMFSGGETVIPSKQSFQIAGLARMMSGGGRQFVDGMIAGVAAGSPAFHAAAQAMAAGGVDAVRAELQIASPSKVMQQIGVYFSEGFIKGLTGSSSAVKSAVTALAAQASKAFEAKGSGKKSGLVEKYTAEVKRLKPLAQSRASVLKSISSAEKKLTTARKNRPSSAALAELQGKVTTAKKKGKGVAAAESALKRAKDRRALPGELETQISQLKKAAKGGAKYRTQLAAAEKKLTAARKLDPGGNAIKQGQAFAKKFAKQTAALTKNAKDRESVAAKIKSAQDKVKEATQARTDFAAGVKGQVTESSSIALSGIVQASQVTDTLKARLGRWKSFISDMAQLKKMGLGNAAYQQLVSAGPEAAGSVAKALLAGGKSSITEVNSLQKQFDTIGTSFGKTTSTVLFQPGVDAANGFLKGFQDQEKKLTAAGTKLAKALAKAVKKELGIKSPSKVFRAVGIFSGQGLVDGLDASQAAVARAGAGLAYAAVATPPASSTTTTTPATADGYVRTLTQSGNVYLGYDPDEIRKAEEKRDRRSARRNNLQGV